MVRTGTGRTGDAKWGRTLAENLRGLLEQKVVIISISISIKVSKYQYSYTY